jgi:hypothetical protein
LRVSNRFLICGAKNINSWYFEIEVVTTNKKWVGLVKLIHIEMQKWGI